MVENDVAEHPRTHIYVVQNNILKWRTSLYQDVIGGVIITEMPLV